jgi:hypothetical protein
MSVGDGFAGAGAGMSSDDCIFCAIVRGDAPATVVNRADGFVAIEDINPKADVHLLAVDHGRALARAEQSAVLARQPDRVRSVRVDQPDQLARDLARQHHPDDVHRLWRRDPQPAAELARDAQPVEHRVDLRTAPVHHDGTQAHLPQEDHVLRERAFEVLVDHRVPAVLHDDERAGEALQPGQGLDEDLGLLVGAQVGAGVEHEVLALVGHVEYALFSWT